MLQTTNKNKNNKIKQNDLDIVTKISHGVLVVNIWKEMEDDVIIMRMCGSYQNIY